MTLSREDCRDLAEHFATKADDAYSHDKAQYEATLSVAYAIMAMDPARGYPTLSEFFEAEDLPVEQDSEGYDLNGPMNRDLYPGERKGDWHRDDD